MGAIIWQKATTMNTSGGGAIMGSFPYPRNGILKMDYEFILIFKKLGTPLKVTLEQKQASIMTKDEWNEYFSSHWNFNGVKQFGHIAMFPEELPKRLIKMFSFAGETVLDPFAGSGTTSLAAMKLGRNSISYEINNEFLPLIKEKLSTTDTSNCIVQFMQDSVVNYSLSSLPYLFSDPHKMDKKIDVKKLHFGSKIDGTEVKKEELFSVKEVISPNTISLSNGLIVKLLGVLPKLGNEQEAIEFLQKKLKKRKVFLKYDAIKYDDSNTLLGYLYLDNKTFINRHLVKTGFVSVDTTIDYKYRKKFMEDCING